MKRLWEFSLLAYSAACATFLCLSCAQPRQRIVVAPRPPASTPRVVVPQPKPPVAQPAEVRAVWVSDTSRLDWDSATAALKRAGFNTMYVNIASGGAAFYPGSALLPNVMDVNGDPLARGLALAHQRGLAVHAKQIVMFMFKTPKQFQKRMLDADRVMRGPDGRPILQNEFTWLCPSQAPNRALTAGALTEILKRYPVDGVQFDYIRFCEQPSCYCASCRREFERSAGLKVKRWPADVLQGEYVSRFNGWRMQLISDWVRELSALARQTRPGVTVSAAVFSDLDRAREEKAQDWKTWLDRGYLDYVCTMTYTTDPNQFESQVRKQQGWAARRNQVVVGIGSWKFQQMDQLWGHISLTRQLGAPGFALFSYDDAEARDFLPNLTAGKGK